MGRPTLLTSELADAIAKDVADGATFEIAAEVNGISRTALFEWQARGKTGEQPYADFAHSLARARAQFKQRAISEIREGMHSNGETRDWRAQAWLLERLDPEQFAPQQAVNLKVDRKMEEILDTLEKTLAPDEYDKALRALVGATGGEAAGAAATPGAGGDPDSVAGDGRT